MNDYWTIIFLMGLMVVCILGMKYIAGDFSTVSIEKVDQHYLIKNNVNGEVIGKKISITYKYTYTDGRVKYKTKIIKL